MLRDDRPGFHGCAMPRDGGALSPSIWLPHEIQTPTRPVKTLLTREDEVCSAWEGRVLLLPWWGYKRWHHPSRGDGAVHRARRHSHAGSRVPIPLFLLNLLHPALHKTFGDAKSVRLLQECENRIFMAFNWKWEDCFREWMTVLVTLVIPSAVLEQTTRKNPLLFPQILMYEDWWKGGEPFRRAQPSSRQKGHHGTRWQLVDLSPLP